MSAHRIAYDLYRAPFTQNVSSTNAESITIDRFNGIIPVTTAGVETRTLARPTKAGILGTVVLKTDGGNLTLTVTGGYNADDDTAIVFGDAGDFVTFRSVEHGGSYYWRVAEQEGTDAAIETLEVDNLTVTSLSVTNIARTGVQRLVNCEAKIGTTAGWTLGAADLGTMATMAASQTAGTLVVPINGLHVGDTITAFSVVGQIESAGNTATLDADLRKLTVVAAAVTDASVGAITQVSVTADTAVSTAKTGLTEVVAADEMFYVLLTGTTAASTDIDLIGLTITVTEA